MNFMKSDPDWDGPYVPEKVDYSMGKAETFKAYGRKITLAICDTCGGKYPYSPKATTCLSCVEDKRVASRPDNLFTPEGIKWLSDSMPPTVGTARQIIALSCGISVEYFNHLSDAEIDAILAEAGARALLDRIEHPPRDR